MAEAIVSHEDITDVPPHPNTGLSLVWLDDSAEGEPQVNEVLCSMYDSVFIFADPEACLDLVQANENKPPCLSILISGRYGQTLVRDHLQPLNQVKDIYVFCMDTIKHSRWAQTCDKVRCVFSDINKIVQCMQYDIQNTLEQQLIEVDEEQQQQQAEHQEKSPTEIKQPQEQQRERFTDDINLFDQLAINLLLQTSDEGVEDFKAYCEKQTKTDDITDDSMKDKDQPTAAAAAAATTTTTTTTDQKEYYQPNQPIGEWYHSDLCFTQINSNNLTQLWSLRWFIRLFYRQLKNEHDKFLVNKTKFTVHHGVWLSDDELDAMKHRIGQIIVFTELFTGFVHQQTALDCLQNDETHQHKVVFEINVDPTIENTIPYAEIKTDEVLFWFGGRYRLVKVEYLEPENEQEKPCWLIGLKLSSTLNPKSSIQTLYNYYLKELQNLNNLHHIFGRLLMYKGSYYQAEQWLQIDNQYLELTELALRQSHFEQAKTYLEHLSDDSDEANLFRAFLNILTSNDNFSKSRLLLMQIFSEATDKLIRARVNLALGFINLILTQQIDQAFEHFTLAHDVFCKLLPEYHPILVKSYLGLGYAYYSQQNIHEARKCFENIFSIQKQIFTYDHPDFAKTRNARAHCFSSEKKTMKRALNELEYALKILLDAFPNDYQHHPEILATKNDIEKLKKGKELRPRNTLLDYI